MRVLGLDGLRGLAALVVLNFHLVNQYLESSDSKVDVVHFIVKGISHTPFALLLMGNEAVHMFFFLSGIALGFAWRAKRVSTLRFLRARLFRLYAPVACAIFLSIATWGILASFAGGESDSVNRLSTLGLLKSFILLFGVGPVLPALWSLTWEVWFSLGVPIFSRLIKTKLVAIQITLCLIAIISGHIFQVGVLRYTPMFLLGLILSLNWGSFEKMAKARFVKLQVTLPLGLLLPVFLIPISGITQAFDSSQVDVRFVSLLAYPLEFLGFALLVAAGSFSPHVEKVLGSKPLKYLGLTSFSLYLTHQNVISLLGFIEITPEFRLIFGLLVSGFVAAAFHRFIESPIHGVARQLSRPKQEGAQP